MYKFILCCCCIATTFTCLNAQVLADFENYSLGENAFLNGSDLSGGFESGNVFLSNQFSTGNYGDFWSGWALSNVMDNTTSGFGNQYSAIAGSGAEDSANYAIGYSFGGEIMRLTERSTVAGLYITNNTYTHNSMRDGDSFAKRFGGETGDDPDFFLLSIKVYSEGELSADSIDFYLADYRFEDNTQDYLVNTWEWIDLSAFGAVDSLLFTLTSSDIGDFGMNTPAYFCADHITTSPVTSVENLEIANLTIYPNPTTEAIFVERATATPLQLSLRDVRGIALHQERFSEQQIAVRMEHLPKGIYFLELRDGQRVQTKTIIKE